MSISIGSVLKRTNHSSADLNFSYKTRMKKMLDDDEDLDIERYHSDEIADASMLSVTS